MSDQDRLPNSKLFGGARDYFRLARRKPARWALPSQHKVAVIPGDAFGMTDGRYFRIAFGALQKATVAEGPGDRTARNPDPIKAISTCSSATADRGKELGVTRSSCRDVSGRAKRSSEHPRGTRAGLTSAIE